MAINRQSLGIIKRPKKLLKKKTIKNMSASERLARRLGRENIITTTQLNENLGQLHINDIINYNKNLINNNIPKKNIVLCIPFFKRDDITNFVFNYYFNLKIKLKNIINIKILTCGSEGEKSKQIAKKYKFLYVDYNNNPLSQKQNILYLTAKKYNPDACVKLDSDTIFSEEFFILINELLNDNYDYISIKDIYFAFNNGIAYWGGYLNDRQGEGHGTGRVLSKKLLNKLDWMPWKSSELNSGLDKYLTFEIEKFENKSKLLSCKENNFLCIDLKSEFGITNFNYDWWYSYENNQNVNNILVNIKDKLIKYEHFNNINLIKNRPKILKVFSELDNPSKYNYEINYGIWDVIYGDVTTIQNFNKNIENYDVIFLPMKKRWDKNMNLFNKIKNSKTKIILFDNDSHYNTFDDEFYSGLDFIFYRNLDKNNKKPLINSSWLPWSINTNKYIPEYGKSNISFNCSISPIYPFRVEIAKIISNTKYVGNLYLNHLQNSGAGIHASSYEMTHAKILEFAACGTEIISNKTKDMNYYFPDELIIYFNSIDELINIINEFKPNIEKQKKLREIAVNLHDNKIRGIEILKIIKNII